VSETKTSEKMRTVTDSAAADDKSIGFDYQYYYFLYKVLCLKKGETAGLEVKDDVHTDLANDYQLLVQVKHTVQENASGKPINLATLDSDLWKTLSKWSKIISDVTADREEEKEQLAFLRKTEFLLVSNKSETKGNEFLKVLENPTDARRIIGEIRTNAKGSKTLEHIDDVLSLDDDVLRLFMLNVGFELGEDEIIQKCKDAIESDKIKLERVDHVFRDLDSQIRQDNFMNVRNGEKITISFSQFQKKYRCFFDRERNTGLIVRKIYKKLPDVLAEQTFIKQLIDIGDLSADDVSRMARYTEYALRVESNLETWVQDGDLTPDDLDRFRDESQLHWENNFRFMYRGKEDDSSIALNLLHEMRKLISKVAGEEMDLLFSNGGFYLLSDIPEIGWLKSWEEKYK
jgi:hypothetical protein